MKHLAQKLKSRRGASMLFALLVFLLCLLAGVTVLTAAAANAGRYTHLENEQRQYLSAASALAPLQTELDEEYTADPVKIEVQRVETYTWHYEQDPSDLTAPYEFKHETDTAYSWSFPNTGTSAPDLTWFQYQLYANSLPAEWRSKLPPPAAPPAGAGVNEAYTVDLDRTAAPQPAWAGSLYPVHVTVKNADAGAAAPGTAASPLALEMRLTTGDDDVYPVRVLWSGEAVTETTSTTETTGDLNATTSGTRTTTTTLTCTLRWSAENRTVTFE